MALIHTRAEAGAGGFEEVAAELVEAGGHASELLEVAEEALDEVAAAGGRGSTERWSLTRRWVGMSGCDDEVEDGAAVVAAVGEHRLGGRQARHKVGDGGLVGALAGGDQQPHGQTVLDDHGVDLGAQSATRTTDGVIRTPFFRPGRAGGRG